MAGAGESTKNIKIWKATKDSNAGVMVTPKSAYLIGSRNNFVAVGDTGVAIVGKSIALNVTTENVRNGGLWTNMNDFVRMVPQTLTTPMPTQIPFPPLGMVTSVIKDLPFFLAMVV